MMNRTMGWRELVALTLLGLFLVVATLVTLNSERPEPRPRAPVFSWQKKNPTANRVLKGELKPVGGKNLKAAFEYTPAAGSLSVYLDRKIEEVPGKLSMDVRLVPRNGKGASHQSELQKQADGRYRTNGIKLSKGEWTLKLVGRRNSEVQFLMEHVVRVD